MFSTLKAQEVVVYSFVYFPDLIEILASKCQNQGGQRTEILLATDLLPLLLSRGLSGTDGFPFIR